MLSMAEQTKESHVRFDPYFHFSLIPLTLALLLWSGYRFLRHPTQTAAFLGLLTLAVLVTEFKARIYALKVQDRVIRLEERLRIQALCPSQLAAQASALSEQQLVGLRFASDGELPSLVAAALSENLDRKQIKQRIQTWRPDHWRV
ncbi:MAG: hypothetical protein NVS9B15_17530 [Acidobacteriaceae bacterium]